MGMPESEEVQKPQKRRVSEAPTVDSLFASCLQGRRGYFRREPVSQYLADPSGLRFERDFVLF